MSTRAAELRAELKLLNNKLRAMEPEAEPPQYSFNVPVWAKHTEHMDPEAREWLLDGLANGFDVHVKQGTDLSRSTVKNLPMDLTKKVATAKWILKNKGNNAIWGGFKKDKSDMPSWIKNELRISPVGAIKKGLHFEVEEKDKQWRVIHHLSHPRTGPSVNSEIKEEWATVQYVQFREVVELVQALGVGAKLWTADAKDAYLRVPIKKSSMRYMGFEWDNRLYVFTCLSFGLASAPRIYTLFADAVLSIIMRRSGPSRWWSMGERELVFHYIDDFFGGAPVGADFESIEQFRSVIYWFDKLGIPTKASKCSAPATRQKILGFVYDTVQGMVFIPTLKKRAILGEIRAMLKRSEVLKKDVLSLIGKLRWASVCIFAGPAFVRKMEDHANRTQRMEQRVKVAPIKSDLRWWDREIQRGGDGVRFVDILRQRANGDVHVYTDASTGDGMGGWNKQGQWFRFKWDDHPRRELFPHPKQPDIYWKEMAAVATAACIWGVQWRGMAVTFWIDNEACVWSLIKRRCSFEREDVMQLIRVIASCANEMGFQPYFIHIRGKDNLTADALSRFDLRMFQEDTRGIEMATRETQCQWVLDRLLALSFDRQEHGLE